MIVLLTGPASGSWPGLLAVVAGGAGEVAGEVAAVDALGLELGFGALGAARSAWVSACAAASWAWQLLAEGVTFAGGVSAGLDCLGTASVSAWGARLISVSAACRVCAAAVIASSRSRRSGRRRRVRR